MQYWPNWPVLMRTKRVEMCAPARVWSGVPHGARAAVLRPEMCHGRAHIAVRQIPNAVACLPYLEGESKLGNMVNLGEVHDGMILTRPLAP